jgi:hypothetical protein
MYKMSDRKPDESFDLLPNRLAVAEFSPIQVDTILGGSSEAGLHNQERELLKSNFNWVAAYLCEEVGIYETELAEWFTSEARSLGGKTPLSVWRGAEGFWKVFEYAQAYKKEVDEALADEEPEVREKTRSHKIAENALGIIMQGFEIAGADIAASEADPEHVRSQTIHNPDRIGDLTIRWKGNQSMEDYRVTVQEGPQMSSYFIVRHLPADGEPLILQTGIGRHLKTDEVDILEIDSDLDGRPPSAGEVASFVVPLANEVKNRSLALMT